MSEAQGSTNEQLDVAAINARIDALGPEADGTLFSRGDAFVLLFWIGSFVVGSAILLWLRNDLGLLLFRIAVWGGFAIGLALLLFRYRAEILNPHQSFAAKMDQDHVVFRKLDVWLRRSSFEDRERLLRFVKARQGILSRQLNTLVGGFQHLGLLPVLVALYLQFRGAGDEGWSHFTQVNWTAQILLAMVLGLYVVATQASRLRKRTELIEVLLVESLQPLR